jgi:hypothetical protein
MRLDPEHAHELLTRVDPGRVRSGQAIGLRDGALLALVAAGLSAVEIATLRASAVTMTSGKLLVAVRRHGLTWFVVLPTDLGARLIAWLTECRLWAVPEPVFRGSRGPLTSMGICKVLERYRNHHQVPVRRGPKISSRRKSGVGL